MPQSAPPPLSPEERIYEYIRCQLDRPDREVPVPCWTSWVNDRRHPDRDD